MKALWDHRELLMVGLVVIGLTVGGSAVGVELRHGQLWAFAGKDVIEIFAILVRM